MEKPSSPQEEILMDDVDRVVDRLKAEGRKFETVEIPFDAPNWDSKVTEMARQGWSVFCFGRSEIIFQR